jgi:peptidoglycan/LPS O-acetylase OafA/YrhL
MRSVPVLLARLVAVSALVVVAAVHLRLAPGYALIGEQVTQGDLFRAQALACGLVAIALLLRPRRPVWFAAAAVALASLVAVVLTTYVAVPAVGPFPRVFEPVWYGEKVLAAVAAAAGLAAALLGTLRSRAPDGRRRGPARVAS